MEQERSAESETKQSGTEAVEAKASATKSGAAESQPARAGSQTEQPAGQSSAPSVTSAPPPLLAVPTGAGVTPEAGNKIGIDDFLKVELRVGEVKVAEKVKGADKLLRLEVDIGSEVRQVVAGIAKAYDPEKLIGRKVVIVANLAPRKLRGLESQGMIVAASFGEDGTPVLAGFLEDVPNGARLK